MNIREQVINAPLVRRVVDEQYCQVAVVYSFKKELYCGGAQLHPSDAGFFSPKIGYRIATYRARIKMLKTVTRQTREKWQTIDRFYKEVVGHGASKKQKAKIDPTGALEQRMKAVQKEYQDCRKALKEMEKELECYLVEIDKAVSTVKAMRAGKSD